MPEPNGARPVAAYAIVAPQEWTSEAELLGCPSITSGARYPGVPMTSPVSVSWVASPACAMPKSITTGRSPVSITLLGFRSRCTTPAAWIAASASAVPQASLRRPEADSGPRARTSCSSVGPGTNLVTM